MSAPESGRTGPATTLSLTAVRVSDLARSVAFYVDGCGFAHERDLETPTFRASILRAGAAGLELLVPAEPEPLEYGNVLVKIVLGTDDVVACMTAACAHGGTEETPPTLLEAYGMVIGTVRDPDGHLVEFVQRNGVKEA
ncbi:VOC family protein [Rhodococcus sp. NPDC003348]